MGKVKDRHGRYKWEEQPTTATMQRCRYCGREVLDMELHIQVFHNPKVDRKQATLSSTWEEAAS